MRRMIALILISICMAGGAAACSAAGASGSRGGGSQASGSQAGETGQAMTVMRQLARCIRSHGRRCHVPLDDRSLRPLDAN